MRISRIFPLRPWVAVLVAVEVLFVLLLVVGGHAAYRNGDRSGAGLLGLTAASIAVNAL